MSTLIVVNNPSDWELQIPGVETVSARAYLTDPTYTDLRRAKVFNLCRSYGYQTLGYYVSLLAEARDHKPMPNVTTIQDMKSQGLVRFVSEDLDEQIQQSLTPVQTREFSLRVYFGRTSAKRHNSLARALFNLFQAPMLRAHFIHNNGKWQLQTLRALPTSEIPPDQKTFLAEVASEYFEGRLPSTRKRVVWRYDLAILHDSSGKHVPSNEKSLLRFVKAANALGMRADLIEKDDYGHLAEYDALFIRETTEVNHHTYRFSRRAKAEGMVVVDDPESIVKCTNKVYLAEVLSRNKLPTPKTLIVHKDNVDAVVQELGLPCILKRPDSSFSQGVIKVEDEKALEVAAEQLHDKSDLFIAQSFLGTDFDWRVGVFDRRPLFVCRYFMAKNHWQIVKRDGEGKSHFGKVETLPVGLAPANVVRTALRAANLIGDGLYGVDLKQVGKKVYVIEVNDNPNIDHGYEDAVLKDELYLSIMRVFLERIEQRTEKRSPASVW